MLVDKGIRELVLNIYIYFWTEGEGRGQLGYISHREKKKALCCLGRVLFIEIEFVL